MIEYVVAAWVSSMECHRNPVAECWVLRPNWGISSQLPEPFCVENTDDVLSANVYIVRMPDRLIITMPPHARPCAIPVS